MDSKALLDNLDVGVAVIAPDWTIGYWSPAAARLTGRPADRVLGQTFWTAFPTAKAVQKVCPNTRSAGRPVRRAAAGLQYPIVQSGAMTATPTSRLSSKALESIRPSCATKKSKDPVGRSRAQRGLY